MRVKAWSCSLLQLLYYVSPHHFECIAGKLHEVGTLQDWHCGWKRLVRAV